MEGCTKFMDDDPSLETVRTDLAELLNFLERYINSLGCCCFIESIVFSGFALQQ